ncbi:hypothetical protein IWX48DRAFT_609614 [Phyllosticta citricarpa]
MLPGVLHTLFLPCGGLLVQRMSPTTMTGLGLLRRVQSHNDMLVRLFSIVSKSAGLAKDPIVQAVDGHWDWLRSERCCHAT